MKDGAALERLAGIDRVVFDKTGTLTTGTPRVTGGPAAAEERAAAAGARAALGASGGAGGGRASRGAGGDADGGAGAAGARRSRDGSAAGWRGSGAPTGSPRSRRAGARSATGTAFAFADGPAVDVLASPRCCGPARGRRWRRCAPTGSTSRSSRATRRGRSAAVARELGHRRATASAQLPADKIARLEALRAAGHRVLMVGDGLNDTAALAAAHVSMAPASAADAGRLAADFVFTRDRLDAVVAAHGIARAAARAGAAELRLRGGLQLPRDPARGRGLRHAADRGARDVGVVDPGRRQRAAAQRPGSAASPSGGRPRACAEAPA